MALVLVIDEDIDFSALVKRVITRQGHEVATFVETKDAIQWLEEHLPDVAIIGAGKYGEKARDLVSKLNSAGITKSRLILSTGIGSVSDVQREFRDRVRSVIPKGSSLDELERLVSSVILS